VKQTIHSGHRIVVQPNLWHPRGLRPGDKGYNEHAQRVCEEIEQAIRHHVDSLAPTGLADHRPAPGAVQIVFDTREECSHCHGLWEVATEEDMAEYGPTEDEHSIVGEPVCCSRAVAEFRRENRIPLGEFAND
jgi:hypothetical protein